jgi:hypothetical protein
VTITNNTLAGYGPDPNAGPTGQVGIEIGDGAQAQINKNTISNNQYAGTNNAGYGVFIYGGPGYKGSGIFEGPNYTTNVVVENNTLTNNDIGVWVSNLNNPANSPLPWTHNVVSGNTITVVSGNTITNDGTSPNPFAAGIVAQSGNGDVIQDNQAYGAGF